MQTNKLPWFSRLSWHLETRWAYFAAPDPLGTMVWLVGWLVGQHFQHSEAILLVWMVWQSCRHECGCNMAFVTVRCTKTRLSCSRSSCSSVTSCVVAVRCCSARHSTSLAISFPTPSTRIVATRRQRNSAMRTNGGRLSLPWRPARHRSVRFYSYSTK